MNLRSNPILILPVAAVTLVLSAVPAAAQKGPHTSMGRPGLTKPAKPEKPAGKATSAPSAAARAVPAPQQQIEKLAALTPEQRQKALAGLPEAKQKQLDQAIANYNKLTPQQRQNAAIRAEKLQSLPPAEKQEVRQSLQAFRELPDDRKKAVRQEVAKLSKLQPTDRDARLAGGEFKSHFSPEEQQIVKNMQLVTPDQF
jgi:hypothetical protein